MSDNNPIFRLTCDENGGWEISKEVPSLSKMGWSSKESMRVGLFKWIVTGSRCQRLGCLMLFTYGGDGGA